MEPAQRLEQGSIFFLGGGPPPQGEVAISATFSKRDSTPDPPQAPYSFFGWGYPVASLIFNSGRTCGPSPVRKRMCLVASICYELPSPFAKHYPAMCGGGIQTKLLSLGINKNLLLKLKPKLIRGQKRLLLDFLLKLKSQRMKKNLSGIKNKSFFILWQAQQFRKVRCRFRGRRSTFARSGIQISHQARHFRKVAYRFRGRRSTFARSGRYLVAGAVLSQGQVQISWQAQHFRKARYRYREISWEAQRFRELLYRLCGRRDFFARYGTYFATGAALSQGTGQAQHFRKR